MRYEKPGVVEVAGVIDAVQSSIIKRAPPIEQLLENTVAAYQSDEE